MKSIIVTIQQLEKFPFHDAELQSFCSCRNPDNGILSATMKIKVTDFSYEVGYSYPQQNGVTELVLEDCRVILTDLKGGFSEGLDTFFEVNLLTDSALIVEACKWPPAKSKQYYHFEFKLNSGSIIKIVAENAQLQSN